MRKTLFLTTAMTALVYASGGWAQDHQERGSTPHTPGEKVGAPAQGEKTGGPAAQGEKAAPRRDESGAPNNGAANRAEGDRNLKTDTDKTSEPKGAASERQNPGREGAAKSKNEDAAKPDNEERGAQSGTRESGERRATSGAGEKGAAQISSEQRAKVQTSLKSAKVPEATGIDVASVRDGESLPRKVASYWKPVPSEIIAIVPEWRDYRVVRLGDKILVINPATYEIVFTIS